MGRTRKGNYYNRNKSGDSQKSKRKNVPKVSEKVAEYHRMSERRRHSALTTALSGLQYFVPGHHARETQIGTLDRAIRYGLYLEQLLQKHEEDRDLIELYQLASAIEQKSKLAKLVSQHDL